MMNTAEQIIEAGTPIEIGTATGSFRAYGHELTLTVLGIETVSTLPAPKANTSTAMSSAESAGSIELN